MSAVATSRRVGWCPGALRPMASGDGLIVRVKPRIGTLTPGQGIGIAEAATRFGNGTLDLTSRANLQIRGAGDATLSALTASLDRLGLLDDSAEAEARRNVVLSPLAGFDPSAAFDIRPAAAALEDRLAADHSLAELPAKFGFALSDGGAFALDDGSADVLFEARRDEGGSPGFVVRLEGDLDRAATCTASAMPEAAARLARAFIAGSKRDRDCRRMRDLVARDGAAAVFAGAGLYMRLHSRTDRGTARTIVGTIVDDGSILGVAAPFGRLDARQLEILARGAADAGRSDLRLTPWRAILVPGLSHAGAVRLAADCAAAGLIVDPADPRLRVTACAGAPGCRRGTTRTLDDAARWARLVGPGSGVALHVSGCVKGCAHTAAAPLTLVGRDGRYDVVVDGRPGDLPAALGLDAAEARRLIRTALRWDERA